jgi:hypothetical protein
MHKVKLPCFLFYFIIGSLGQAIIGGGGQGSVSRGRLGGYKTRAYILFSLVVSEPTWLHHLHLKRKRWQERAQSEAGGITGCLECLSPFLAG